MHLKKARKSGLILGLALNGQKDHALQALGQGQTYTKLSGQLMLAMRQWENSLPSN